MKFLLNFCLLFVCLATNICGQKIEREIQFEKDLIAPARAKPLSHWLGLLDSKIAHERKYAVESLGLLGPDAAGAVPALTKLVDDPDWEVKRATFDTLTKIADGADTSPAARVLIDIIAKTRDYRTNREYALAGLIKIYDTRRILSVDALPGWIGIFPRRLPGQRTWHPPIISPDGKNYSQKMTESFVGGSPGFDSSLTLARGPDFARQYSEAVLMKAPTLPISNTPENERYIIGILTRKIKSGPLIVR